MTSVAVIAPHPDDETLGCGGTLLRHSAAADEVHWLVATTMTRAAGFDNTSIAAREDEIAAVTAHYDFASVHRLGFPATELDVVPRRDVVRGIGRVFTETRPDTVYVPFEGDAHSDHAVIFQATLACAKWFRYPSVKRLYAYETLSETEFGFGCEGFRPTLFVDITEFLDGKIEALNLYRGEVTNSPFPRSGEIVRAQARVRGSTVGSEAAEAFMVVRESR